MPKQIRPPDPRGGLRVEERWREAVSKRLTGSTYSLDDIARALFLTNTTTQGLENRRLIAQNATLAAENRTLRGRITELQKKLKELEVVAWL